MAYPRTMIDYPAPDLNLISGTISIAVATAAYLIYHFSITSVRLNKHLRNKFGELSGSIRKVLYQRLLGGILYGAVPLLIVILLFRRPLNQYGFAGDHVMKSFFWWIPIAIVLVILTYIGAKNEKNLEMYPQIRTRQWNAGLIIVSALSWVAYLVGYEFLFRGFLLFSCLESFGYWPAIIINICLYSLFHIAKGSREAIGSLFFGFLLCYLSLQLGSCWFAIFTHITIALSNEWFSLGFQPDMKFIKTNRSK